LFRVRRGIKMHSHERPGFADYEAKTDREIPVVILEQR
jgi:hypothetical protein